MDNKIPSVGSTLTSGIQDISALLPLLGTERCEQHIGSGLSGGFLYVAATPMSIFGSLGMARAGFKGLIASISNRRWRIIGAQKLNDAGFAASGTNLSLIMMDSNHQRCHLAETRLDSLLETLHIEDLERLTVITRCQKWNLKMLFLAAILTIIGLMPYIHLNLYNNAHPRGIRWLFPITRVMGGFFTATSLQFLIQRRLISLIRRRLAFRALDAHVRANKITLPHGVLWDPHISSEMCLWSLEYSLHFRQKSMPYEALRRLLSYGIIARGGRSDQKSPTDSPLGPRSPPKEKELPKKDVESGLGYEDIQHTDSLKTKLADIKRHFGSGTSETLWPFSILITLGVAASVIGYVGCFSVVQSSSNSTGPLIWLVLEGVLSIARMALWGWNADYDNLDPLILSLKLDKYPPLPTCNISDDKIQLYERMTLSLARATEFLQSITAYAGLVKRFDHPNLSLFYTLTRRAAEAPGIHQRALYITIFDHKERTTRVYYEDANNNPKFMFTQDGLHIDTERGLLKTTIMEHPESDNDPVISDQSLRFDLQQHYRSILSRLQSRAEHPERDTDDIENSWTLEIVGAAVLSSQEATTKGNSSEDVACAVSDESSSLSRVRSESLENDLGTAGESAVTEHNPEYDDAEYLKQGNHQLKLHWMLFPRRASWVDQYMEYVSNGRTTTSHDSQITEVMEMQAEMREYMLLYERVEMEYILFDEMRKWEEFLRTDHEQMLMNITTKRGSDRSLIGLEKRLEKDWKIDALYRVSGYEVGTRKRLDKEAIRIDHLSGPGWEQGLKEVWKEASQCIAFAWRDYNGRLRGEDPESVQPREYVLDTLIGGKIRRIIDDHGDETIRITMRNLHEALVKAATIRLRREKEDVDLRVRRDLLPHCDDFRIFARSAEIILGGSKWARVYRDDFLWGGAECEKSIPRALGRNGRVFFIQFSGYDHDLSLLIKAMSMLRDTPSVTTLAFPLAMMEMRATHLAALLEALSQNRGIISICGLNLGSMPEINQQLAVNQAEARSKITPVVAHGFLIGPNDDDDNLCGGLESRLDLSFIGPSEEALLLSLRHRFTKPPCIRINNTIEITYPASEPGSLELQIMRLEPIRDFRPGSANVLSITPAEEHYAIADIDLCDEQGKSILIS